MPLETLNATSLTLVEDLEPLRGLPLRSLNLHRSTRVKSLEPLRGMPLNDLTITATGVSDVSPLADTPLRQLTFEVGRIERGFDVLRALSELRGIYVGTGRLTPAEFWKRYDAGEYSKKN
jgi:hypothetical protein